VSYVVEMTDGTELAVDNPSKMPEPQKIEEIREPWVSVTIITPARFIGPIMDLVTGRRGEYVKMEYLQPGSRPQEGQSPNQDARVLLEYNMPLSEMLVDFHDQLKSRTQGYASMDYSLTGHRPGDLVKLDVLVNYEPVDALSLILHRANAQGQGRELVSRLRQLIPRQLFEVPVQAAIGGKVIARETVRAMRKDVLAKCYGGDVTRKRKLLEKQAEGKKRLKRIGKVELPQEAFMAVLKLERR
jgi:GTP-binding protein LepA